ncbi:MAG: hypothetical protein K0Q73_5571 [Paenibacillus sp.]|jgi:uncharacterized membrane protein YphA (DoxX/SURF4 family)|nr:hypothetical protein [Paenibacillus sp.]
MKNERIKTIAFWIITILGPGNFVIGGFLDITRNEDVLETVNGLGYPDYLVSILGVFKLLGVIAILLPGLPRLKEWAYAGFFFNLSGAALSLAYSGQSMGIILSQPLFFLSLVIASWALRPSSRKLAGKIL